MPQQPYDKVFAELYDLSGKRIQQLIINTGHNEMDVSALPAGTYQLQLYSRKERSVRKILIAGNSRIYQMIILKEPLYFNFGH
jgi:hypothetical protein